MGITDYDMHKIIDDLKRVSRIIPILKYAKGKEQKERIAQLALDELQKLTDDIEEIKNSNGKKRRSNMPDNYQHEMVCPKCKKRKVYVGESADGYYYYCKVCDWRKEIPA